VGANPPLTGWSPDANWFWDGSKWRDAVSPDGKWRFDGSAWLPFTGLRSPMPLAPFQPGPPPPPPAAGLPSWVAASEVERLQAREEAREPASVGPPPELPQEVDVGSGHPVVGKVLLWAGVVLGAGVLVFGLLGLASPTLHQSTVPFAVFVVVLGGTVAASCLLQLFSPGLLADSFGAVGMVVRSLGILGSLVILGMIVNTWISLSRPVGSGRNVIPWATVLVIAFRAWRGRWLAAVIIGATWAAAFLLTSAMGR